jgi:hypothetical protein
MYLRKMVGCTRELVVSRPWGSNYDTTDTAEIESAKCRSKDAPS